MIIQESTLFTRYVDTLLTDDEYAELQWTLVHNPKMGDVIQGTGGLRKVRWAAQGKGKSGGVRVIYYYLSARNQLRMVLIYRKGVKDDLNAQEKKELKGLNDNWK
jgi:hypothetical protein